MRTAQERLQAELDELARTVQYIAGEVRRGHYFVAATKLVCVAGAIPEIYAKLRDQDRGTPFADLYR